MTAVALPPIAACPRMLAMPRTCAASFTPDPPFGEKFMLDCLDFDRPPPAKHPPAPRLPTHLGRSIDVATTSPHLKIP
jgi:hypothetical protein